MPTRRIIDSWLKAITPHTFTPPELAELLMALGIEMEVVDDRVAKLAGFIVGEVISSEKHPNADKLSVCTVSIGTADNLTVVCGAPNVAAGQKIAFAPVGTNVPTAGFTIERRKIRGIESQGMICSESELGLGDGHDGILVLRHDAVVGDPLASILGDVVYDTEITANRADCLSHLGIAREVAAVTGGEIFLPAVDFIESDVATADHVKVSLPEPDLCPRYAARIVRGVKIAPSPEWLQNTIRMLGLRPRNNIVDSASYVMFECGHPLHAFDFGRVAGAEIVVRSVAGGEEFTTLDGANHKLPAGALMICDAEKPIAIAGVMGGLNSEITDDTVDVLIESAYFHPPSIRRTAKLLGISSDASYRFERGADINNVRFALERAASMIAQLAGGEVLNGVLDSYPVQHAEVIVELRFARTGVLVGIAIPPNVQTDLLRRLGFGVHVVDDNHAMVSVPSFRVDVSSEVDLIEEIARSYGYDRIPLDTTATFSFSLSVDPKLRLVEHTRAFFVDNGAIETASNYLIDPETAQRYGVPIELRNALGRDFSALRTSVVPSLARTVGMNERHGRRTLRLFEVGKAFRANTSSSTAIDGVVEMNEIAVLLAGRAEPVSWDLPERMYDVFDLRGLLERYLVRVDAESLEFRSSNDARWGFGAPALEIWMGGEEVGRLGPLDDWLIARNDIASRPVVAVLDVDRVLKATGRRERYNAPTRYPVVHRDLSIIVDEATRHADLERTIRDAGGPLLTGVELFDLYRGDRLGAGRISLAYAVSFTSFEATMDDATIEGAMRSITERLAGEHNAQLRGA
ncbi:MAG: phenylalanine--tRNA ligase subunit beta [bacterium]|nr:phenylalanine--tRNA ligase subunit beta [Candidatus Kapabacteria bacterium]